MLFGLDLLRDDLILQFFPKAIKIDWVDDSNTRLLFNSLEDAYESLVSKVCWNSCNPMCHLTSLVGKNKTPEQLSKVWFELMPVWFDGY